MTVGRARAQSLVELALVAPVLIVLALAAWDGGSALREQVVLQQAARDGARVAATGYGPGGVPASSICAAVSASAADLPGLGCGAANVTYPPGAVTVQLSYPHTLFTPVLRNLWGGGTLTLHASATFYLPQQTPVPATIVPSTFTPTPTSTATTQPTATATPLPPTPTPTATPGPCTFSIPPTNINSGYFVGITVTADGRPIVATWTTATVGGSINIYIYPGAPSTYFGDDTNPTSKNTSAPSGDIATGATTANSLTVQTPGAVSAGSYTIYFFKQGVALSDTTSGTLSFAGSQCPG